MIPRLKPDIKKQELFASVNIFKKNAVKNFEQQFAMTMQANWSQSFSYGRSAIYCILKALHLEGREVICPSYTCVVVPHAIVTAGCIPVFVDSDENDFNMNLDLVEQAITQNTGVIIATSIFGCPVNLEKLNKIKKKHPHIIIIQDCAHSFIAQYKKQNVHSHGDFAIFALNISKIITSIFGGMLITNNPRYFEKIKIFYNKEFKKPVFFKRIKLVLYLFSVYFAFQPKIYKLINLLEVSGLLNRYVKYFNENIIDMPNDFLEQLTNVQARVGLIQLNKIEEIILHRRTLAKIYEFNLTGVPYLRLPNHDDGSSFSHYVILTDKANSLLHYMHKKGIQLGELIDYHIPDLPAYQTYKFVNNHVAENYPGKVINLPIHKGITEKDAEKISQYIKDFFNI